MPLLSRTTAGFALGPVLVGLLSDLSTLPTALALLAVPALVVAVAGPLLLSRDAPVSPGSARPTTGRP